MTTTELIRRVYSKLAHEGEDSSGIFEPDIAAQVQPALIDLGREIAEMTDGTDVLFRNLYNVTLASAGPDTFTGSLSSALTDASKPMILKLPFAMVTYTGSVVTLAAEIGYVADPAVAALMDPANDIAYYAIEQGTKLTIYSTANLNGESVQVLANYVPLLTDTFLTKPLQSRLIELVVEKITGPRPAKKATNGPKK